MGNNLISNKKTSSYIGLFFVVFVWGCAPLLTLELYKYFSPTIRVCLSESAALVAYILVSVKHLKRFNCEYLKVGIPTGIFLALANISQKIGLLYTTPARYAFLENLSCITVPILMFILVRKKITFVTVLSCFMCLASIFTLNKVSFGGSSSWGIGEILCAISGLLYGFNIAGTGVYAKKLFAPLYLAVQSAVGVITSLIFSVVLNSVTYVNAEGIRAPLEKIVFSLRIEHILFAVVVAVLSSALCWIIRTNALKHIEANIVAVIMPFSAVVTGVLSVIFGTDILDIHLILGAVLGMGAIFLSSYDDLLKRR